MNDNRTSNELLRALKDLVRAYVNTMENGRDRIVSLGGQCDPVDVMERGDPYLISAKAAIAKAESTADEPRAADAVDMENIGRAFMDAVHKHMPGYSWSDCPSEAIVDLINMRDDARVGQPPKSSLPLMRLGTMDGIPLKDRECWQAIDVGNHLAAVLVAMRMSDEDVEPGKPTEYGQKIVSALLALNWIGAGQPPSVALEALRKIYEDIPARPNMTEAGRVAMMAEIARAALTKCGEGQS